MREGYGTCSVINPRRMREGYGTCSVIRSFVHSFIQFNSIQFNLDFTDRINRKRGVVKSGNNKSFWLKGYL